MSQGWIGVDLDGTLAEYHEWVSEDHIGRPIQAMVERVKRWRAKDREVRIFTARVDGGPNVRDVSRTRRVIEAWSLEHIGEVLTITNQKDYGMIRLYDDRAVQVEANTGRLIANDLDDAEMY